MDDHWHSFTITDALGDRYGSNWSPPPHLRPRGTGNNPLPEPSSIVESVPTPWISVYQVFDGSSIHTSTRTMPLTTKPATTMTTSGTTKTIPATTFGAADDGPHVYPADGCWDDPGCWYSKTHTATAPTPTSTTVASGSQEQHSSATALWKQRAPYFGAGIGAAVVIALIVVGVVLGLRYRAKKRQDGAKERQSKRMSDDADGNATATVIELGPMANRNVRPGSTRIYDEGWFGGRSDEGLEPGRRDGGRNLAAGNL
ncbi:MAG: hypothetical protein L6R40_001972 [Gallowayella cf. fulva]|nr:MAG: hypothetical protein L6R40_001972 [Xanthomendoza cf. fulva]